MVVGDTVVIKNANKYSFPNKWDLVEYYVPNYKSMFHYGLSVNNGEIGTIVAKVKSDISGVKWLYLVKIKDNVYVLGQQGLKLYADEDE